jgi:hypothetical protein
VKFPSLRVRMLTLGCLLAFASGVNAQGFDIAKLFPDNTEMAFSFNVKSLLNSSFFQKHFKEEVDKQLKNNAQLQKVMETISFDPMRDLVTVTFTISKFAVTNPGSPPDVDGFAVVRGAFNVEKMNGALGALIAAANAGDRVTTSKFGDYILYEVKDARSGKSFHATIFDKETIFGGTVKEDVTNAIERAIGRKAGTLNNRFTDLMGKARNDNTMWGAILTPSSVKNMVQNSPAPLEVADTIAKLDAQTMNLNIKDNIRFEHTMYMAEEGAASQLKTQMDQLKELAGAFVLSNEQIGAELADIVSSLQVGSNGKKVSLTGDIKAELADKIVKVMKERGR